MRKFCFVAAIACALGTLPAVGSAATSLSVPATTNIFKASPTGGGDGIAPVGTVFAPGSGLLLTFSSITGLANCCSGTPNAEPDGTTGRIDSTNTNVSSSGGISGMAALGRQLFLAGLFVDSTSLPGGSAPAGLSYGGAGIGYDLSSYAPLLNQTFYIGDGLTGTGSGSVQSFVVPAGADTLFLGFLDSFGFVGVPSFYNDNRGQFEVTFTIASATVVPLPAALPLGVTALAGLVALSRCNRRRA